MMLDDRCIECKWASSPHSGACKICQDQPDCFPAAWEQTDRPIYCSCGHAFSNIDDIMFSIRCPRCDEPFHTLQQFYTYQEIAENHLPNKYDQPIEKKLDNSSEPCYTNKNIEDVVKVVAERLSRLYPNYHYISTGELPRAFDMNWELLVDEVIEIFYSLGFNIEKKEKGE